MVHMTQTLPATPVLALDALEEAVIVTDPQGTVTAWNLGAERLYGWTSAEAVGRGLGEMLVPDELSANSAEIMERVRAGESWSGEFHVRCRNGSTVLAHVTDTPLFDSDRELVGIVGVSYDLNERLGLIEGLQRQLQAQQFLAEAGAILAGSLDYQTTLGNVARLAVPRLADWCAIYALEDNRISCVEIAIAEPEDEAQSELARYLKEQQGAVETVKKSVADVIRTGRPLIRQDPSEDDLVAIAAEREGPLALRARVPFRSSLVLPLTAHGAVLGAISLRMIRSGRRFSELDVPFAEELARRTALALENARLYEDAREAARRREEFVSLASHELRSPLTSVLGFSRRLARRADRFDEQSREEIGLVVREAERMQATLEVFLDMARLEADRLVLDTDEVDLVELLSEEAAALRGRHPHVRLQEHYPERAPLLESDPYRIRQVVTNLLDNAAKYGGPNPIVDLSARVDGDYVEIGVRDRGPGIAPDDQPHVFERLYRGRSDAARGSKGLGLGLYISQQLAERLGGSLTFTSEPGAGTEFTFRLRRTLTEA